MQALSLQDPTTCPAEIHGVCTCTRRMRASQSYPIPGATISTSKSCSAPPLLSQASSCTSRSQLTRAPSAEAAHRVSRQPSANVRVYWGRTVLRDTAGPCHPAAWDKHGSRNPPCRDFPELFCPGQSLSSRPHSSSLQPSCRPTPSQTEDFSYAILLALLPPASPQAKKFFCQWEAESSFKNREILSQ